MIHHSWVAVGTGITVQKAIHRFARITPRLALYWEDKGKKREVGWQQAR